MINYGLFDLYISNIVEYNLNTDNYLILMYNLLRVAVLVFVKTKFS
jgi:hypothetical protein